MSFSSYLEREGESYAEQAKKKKRKLLTDYARELGAFGATGEDLESRGLGNSGYAAYLKGKLGTGLNEALAEVDEEYRIKEAKAKGGYLGYLADFDKEQMKLRENTVSELVSAQVLDVDKIYAYAEAKGLSGKAAKGLYESVYNAIGTKLKKEIVDKIHAGFISPYSASLYAKELGLNNADIAEIEQLAARYASKLSENSSGYLDYLESLASKNTVSYGG